MESFVRGDPDWLIFNTLKYQVCEDSGTLVFLYVKVHERIASRLELIGDLP